MSNYRDMYLEMVRATEKAIKILIQAQQDAEELYLSSPDPELKILSFTDTAETTDHPTDSNK